MLLMHTHAHTLSLALSFLSMTMVAMIKSPPVASDGVISSCHVLEGQLSLMLQDRLVFFSANSHNVDSIVWISQFQTKPTTQCEISRFPRSTDLQTFTFYLTRLAPLTCRDPKPTSVLLAITHSALMLSGKNEKDWRLSGHLLPSDSSPIPPSLLPISNSSLRGLSVLVSLCIFVSSMCCLVCHV